MSAARRNRVAQKRTLVTSTAADLLASRALDGRGAAQQPGTAASSQGAASNSGADGSAPAPGYDIGPRVRQQLDLLGPSHVGYGALPVPGKAVSVVGARPFTKASAAPSLGPPAPAVVKG
jgi:hypothetical protein